MVFLSNQTIGFLNNQTDSHGPKMYLERQKTYMTQVKGDHGESAFS